MKRLWPLTSRAVRAVRPRHIASIADRTVVFDEGKHWRARPLLHLPGELDRVISHHPDSVPAINSQLIECDNYFQGPTRGFLLENAVIADGSVLTSAWVDPIRHQSRRAVLPPIELYFDEAAMCSTAVSERYFGHWLRDQLPHEMLAADLGLEPLALPGTVRAHEPGYRTMTGLHARKPELARVGKLWLFEDFAITVHRIERIERLRDRLRRAAPSGGAAVVFLARGRNAVGRSLANEAELAKELATDGIVSMTPETMEPAEIVQELRDVQVVIGPEGSAMAHALCAMPHGSAMIQIQPPRQFNLHYRTYCEALDLGYAITIGDDLNGDCYTISADRVRQTLDLVLRHSEGKPNL